MKKIISGTRLFGCLFLCVVLVTAQYVSVERTETDSIRLSWPAESGASYRVLARSNLSGQWDALSARVTAETSVAEFLVERSRTCEWFAVLREPEEGGTLALSPEQALNGVVNVFAVGTPIAGRTMSLFELLDVTDGKTNRLATAYADGSDAVGFSFDTSCMRNGRRLLSVRVCDDGGSDAYEYVSEPTVVFIENGISVPASQNAITGWMLQFEFSSSFPSYRWSVEVYDDTETLCGIAEGDSTMVGPNGCVEIADGWVFEPDGTPRVRSVYDQYETSYFDIYITVDEAGASQSGIGLQHVVKHDIEQPQRRFRKYFRELVAHRPNSRLALVGLDSTIIKAHEDSQDRLLLNHIIDNALVGFSIIASHLDLQSMTVTKDPMPYAQAWNHLEHEGMWERLNYAIAFRKTGFNPSPRRLTHLFTLSHGNERGIGAREGRGLEGTVNEEILRALGHSQTNGLTYVFIDACEAAKGSFIPSLLLNAGEGDVLSRAQLIRQGLFPHYGCGWRRSKYIQFLNNLIPGHAEYVQLYFDELFEPDPYVGLPANTYEQARNRAQYLRENPTAINAYGYYFWKDFGCRELYIDE